MLLRAALILLAVVSFNYMFYFFTAYKKHAPQPLPKVKPPEWTPLSQTLNLTVFGQIYRDGMKDYVLGHVVLSAVGPFACAWGIHLMSAIVELGPLGKAMILATPTMVQGLISPYLNAFNEALWAFASFSAVVMYHIYYKLYTQIRHGGVPNEDYLGLISAIGSPFFGLILSNTVSRNWVGVIACAIPLGLAFYLLYEQWTTWLMQVFLPWIRAKFLQLFSKFKQLFSRAPVATGSATQEQNQDTGELLVDMRQNEGHDVQGG